jgi:hypothetical protein
MGRAKISIPVEDLRRLYLEERWSPARIAAQFNCTSITVRHRLLEAGIALKTKSAAQSKYEKVDFCGTDSEKSHMLGFRYGDLNAYQPKPTSEIVVVRCHTTQKAQEEVFEKLFSRYGKIVSSRNARSVHINCYLNQSFNFLLTKYPDAMRDWLHLSDSRLWPFAAGYIDAEGTFGLNQGKGRFKIDAYDYEILTDIHELFLRNGINSKFRVIAKEGENDYGWVWKRDVWRVSVNEAKSLEMLIQAVDPFLQHAKRKDDARIVLSNVLQRRRHGSIP